VNRLGALRSDHDIFQTFEGDNTVLLQQVGAGTLGRAGSGREERGRRAGGALAVHRMLGALLGTERA
jgi:acyl-CoA oxidase